MTSMDPLRMSNHRTQLPVMNMASMSSPRSDRSGSDLGDRSQTDTEYSSGDDSPVVNLSFNRSHRTPAPPVGIPQQTQPSPKPAGRAISGIDYGLDMIPNKKAKASGNESPRYSSYEKHSNANSARSAASSESGNSGGFIAGLPGGPRRPVEAISMSDESEGEDMNGNLLDEGIANNLRQNLGMSQEPRFSENLTHEQIVDRKEGALAHLSRLEKQGYTTAKKYSMTNDLEDIESAVKKLKDQRSLDSSIKTQRKFLIGFVSVVEYLNSSYNPFDLQLEGWSEAVYENINSYDEVFEELHDKYKEQVAMGPELKLLGMIAGSAMMFHFSKVIFTKAKSQVPGFQQVMDSDPELKRRYQERAAHVASAAPPTQNAAPQNNASNAGGGLGMLGNLIGNFTGNPGLGNMMGNLMGGMGGMGNNQQSQQRQAPGQQQDVPPRRTKNSKTMEGDVDDLLSSLTGPAAENLVEEDIDLSEIDNISDLSDNNM